MSRKTLNFSGVPFSLRHKGNATDGRRFLCGIFLFSFCGRPSVHATHQLYWCTALGGRVYMPATSRTGVLLWTAECTYQPLAVLMYGPGRLSVHTGYQQYWPGLLSVHTSHQLYWCTDLGGRVYIPVTSCTAVLPWMAECTYQPPAILVYCSGLPSVHSSHQMYWCTALGGRV